MMNDKYKNVQRPKTCAAFEYWDIDPKLVVADSLTEDGYEVFIVGSDGRKKLSDDMVTTMRVFVPWEEHQDSIYHVWLSEGGSVWR
jgi:hypothetical protein